jgi:hypothetical protein
VLLLAAVVLNCLGVDGPVIQGKIRGSMCCLKAGTADLDTPIDLDSDCLAANMPVGKIRAEMTSGVIRSERSLQATAQKSSPDIDGPAME